MRASQDNLIGLSALPWAATGGARAGIIAIAIPPRVP